MKKKMTVKEYENELADKFVAPSTNIEQREGFVNGDWFADYGDFDRLKDSKEIYVRSFFDGETYDICSFGCDETETVKANAALIAQAKNMYYALKDFMKVVDGISSVPTGSKLTVTIDASIFENASTILLKANSKQ